jgi:hypothetical protein
MKHNIALQIFSNTPLCVPTTTKRTSGILNYILDPTQSAPLDHLNEPEIKNLVPVIQFIIHGDPSQGTNRSLWREKHRIINHRWRLDWINDMYDGTDSVVGNVEVR